MLDSLWLGAAAMLNMSGPNFHEEVFALPGGEVEISTDFEWNAMTLATNDGSTVPKIWYEKDGEMQPWYSAETDLGDSDPDQLNLLFSGNPRTKIIVASEEPVELVGHFFNTRVAGENQVAQNFDPIHQETKRFANKSKIPSFVDRASWGADESLRTWKIRRGIRSFFRYIAPEARKLPEAERPIIRQRTDREGRRLTWPIEENQVINKFIVHHTGEVVDEAREPKELMRAIYYYHTITRGWGDIGYNYVIDKQGNIYEGRAGGIATVGAHTAYYNTGTIGISLMGNFQVEEPTEAQLKVLTLLIADHSVRFNLNPIGKGSWLGTFSDNIAGHNDVAQPGHGTACPGKNLHSKLPSIRVEAKRLADDLKKFRGITTRDRLRKSKDAPQVRGHIDRSPKINHDSVALGQVIKEENMQRGERGHLELKITNNTETTWLKGERLTVTQKPEGIAMTDFVAQENILPGRTGVFRARIMINDAPNGVYSMAITPLITTLGETDQYKPINYPIRIAGDRSNLTRSLADIKKEQNANNKTNISRHMRASVIRDQVKASAPVEEFGPETKIKLSYFKEKYAIVSGSQKVELWSQGSKFDVIDALEKIRIRPLTDHAFTVEYEGNTHDLVNPQLITSGVLKIENYDRGLGSIPYNQFRHQLNFWHNGNANFYIVNQLPIEKYLWGLAEEPVTEPDEKKHAIHILARSYAYVYGGTRRKFKTPNYDLEDSPATSQFYLGYDWERYHEHQKNLISETKGVMLMYQGKPVIGPYFTQSDGQSESKWVSQYPWTVGRPLPHDVGLEAKGHEVGLSGNSARVLANQGKSYREILDYFYTGTSVDKVY